MKKDMLILPLQFFAEPGTDAAADTAAEDKTAGQTEEKSTDTVKTFTQAELDAAISKAVDAHSKRKEKEFQKLLDKAKEDGVVKGKSYAELTEEQRKEHDFSEREKKLQERERELLTKERLTLITSDLQKEGLPVELAPHLVREEDDEKVKSSIADLKKVWDAAVSDKVKTALRQDPPKSDKTAEGKVKTDAELIAEQRNNQTKVQGFDPWAKK